MSYPILTCTPVFLPDEMLIDAAETAVRINPLNAPPSLGCCQVNESVLNTFQPMHLALLTSKYHGAQGGEFTVSFMESTPSDLADRIVAKANAWSEFCNIKFRLTARDGQVRISRGVGGYYSYLGTDNFHIPLSQQTMNLEAFTMQTPESEYNRVVKHEFGHFLGWPHEHQLPEIVARLNPDKTIAYFMRTQRWSAQTTRQQVLTPLDPSTLRMTTHADQQSVMAYQLPAEITYDGQPVIGGVDIDALDKQFAASVYPLPVTPPSPPPPKPSGYRVVLQSDSPITLAL